MLSVMRKGVTTYKMNKDGITGAKTVLDVPPIYLSSKSRDELISTLL